MIDLHQGRLARAIAADQPDAAPGGIAADRAVKDRAPAEANRNAIDGQHVGALAFKCWLPKTGRQSREKSDNRRYVKRSSNSQPAARVRKWPLADGLLMAAFDLATRYEALTGETVNLDPDDPELQNALADRLAEVAARRGHEAR